MNIFYLDPDPQLAAQMQCDRHVVKMILETAQLLSTAHRVLDGDERADRLGLYKATHKNHPSAVWARESLAHYDWLYSHFTSLCGEYQYRYSKRHKTSQTIGDSLWYTPMALETTTWSNPPQCMPDEYKDDADPVAGYRNYYALDKASNDWFCYNKSRSAPSFIQEIRNGCPA